MNEKQQRVKEILSSHKKERREMIARKQKLQENIYEKTEKIDNILVAAIRECAKTGDIAISSEIAQRFRMQANLSDSQNKELDLYIVACAAYRNLQRSFSAFYESEAFHSICQAYETGNEPKWSRRHILPRLADSDYRGFAMGDQQQQNEAAKNNL
jgi:hypothetical protein